jgi:ABC-type transport system substrate-binding protein
MIAKNRWWDKFGEPQYGDEITIRANKNIANFDPYFTEGLTSIFGGWMERLFCDDWTVGREEWDFRIAWHPSKFQKGQLAESWDFPEPGTHVVHIRRGVHWQNIPPANGREFTADDVVFHYNRLYGMGGGYNKPSPYRDADVRFQDLISVKAADRYTVVFKFKITSEDSIIETLHNVSQAQCLENPDAVRMWGDVSDWHHAIGTGAFILKDFISGESATLVRNPNYWGHDERHPQNRLPYADGIKFLIIPDQAEALAAIRKGKIDILDGVSFKDAQAMRQTNPEIIQIPTPRASAKTLDPRNDIAPYNDLRVRIALQKAIDLPSIAKNYYGGAVEPYPTSLTSKYMKGWGFPYVEWPQDLKEEYAYDPTAARRLLAEAGYPDGFKTNVIADTLADMALLKIVQDYLAEIGVIIQIKLMESPVWVEFVHGHRHDGLTYRKDGTLGHTYAPLRAITRFKTGYSANYNMVSDPVYDTFYQRSLAAKNLDALKPVLKDANERIARQHYSISLLQPTTFSLCQPWIKGYDAQIHSTWMSGGGPSMLSFYGARFWVDRKLKKRIGC